MGRRITVPAEFNALDEAVHDSGAPESSWLGREVSQRDRWLDSELKRSWGTAFPLGQPVGAHRGWAEPQLIHPGRLGPWSHRGTPGCSKLGGEWYVRANITNLAEVIVMPYVSQPALLPVRRPTDRELLGEFTMTGSGAAANYGPIATPLVEGPQRLGLVVWPPAAAYVTSGNVERLHLSTLQSTAASFGALVRPYPRVRVVDAAARVVVDWIQITGVSSTVLAADTLTLAQDATRLPETYDASDALVWQCSAAVSAVSLGHLICVYGREVPA